MVEWQKSQRLGCFTGPYSTSDRGSKSQKFYFFQNRVENLILYILGYSLMIKTQFDEFGPFLARCKGPSKPLSFMTKKNNFP